MAILNIDGLAINYGYISALRDVSMEVNAGEIVTLIGGNGAGKTTTLMSISNLITKAKGSVTFKGVDISRLAPNKIVRMGISHVPEGRKIFPALSVHENLIAGTVGNPGLSSNRIEELLDFSFSLFPRLKERFKQHGGSLSGGEQQMLAIARGLMMDPDLIMLDEPSLGLAPILVEEIFKMIVEIRKAGKTILLIEQNAAMALAIADRGYVLETGNVILQGTGKELLDDPAVKKAYLGY
jgi:branched-chain amino acid transport system ATP-binding protein